MNNINSNTSLRPPLKGKPNMMQISAWRSLDKNTLRGAFTLKLESGLVIHDVMLHVKNDQRWIQFPAREYIDPQGQRQFARFIEFRDRQTGDRFRDAVLAVLDNEKPWEKR